MSSRSRSPALAPCATNLLPRVRRVKWHEPPLHRALLPRGPGRSRRRIYFRQSRYRSRVPDRGSGELGQARAQAPRSDPCPHEVVAVHMAAGYALATGRAQAVFVHVDAGTANACMAIQNLFRYRLPVLMFAGRAPFTLHGELPGSRDTYVHFVQDPFDIASIVRPYVRWEYSLPSGVVVKEALARASAFAHSDPPGPVYMMLPRETLAEEWDEAEMPAYPPSRYGSVRAGGVEPARAQAIAKELMAAENPVAFAGYLGRKPDAVAALDRLARACGIRVA